MEINAAASVSAIASSDLSGLRTTYVFVDGIAGTSPKLGTISSIAFSRYTVQICLQVEFDALAKPRYRVCTPSTSTLLIDQNAN